MAQYIKKEMPDMSGTGEKKAYYKLKTWRKLDFEEFVKRCSSIHRAYGKSVIEGVVMAVCEHLAYEISNDTALRLTAWVRSMPNWAFAKTRRWTTLQKEPPSVMPKALR